MPTVEMLVLTGTHVVVYSKNAETDRVFFKDILGLHSVDAGHAWLIFAVPDAEVAFHPHTQKEMAALRKKGLRFGEIAEERYGTRTTMLLPSGGVIGLYEAKHPVTFSTKGRKRKVPKSKGRKTGLSPDKNSYLPNRHVSV